MTSSVRREFRSFNHQKTFQASLIQPGCCLSEVISPTSEPLESGVAKMASKLEDEESSEEES